MIVTLLMAAGVSFLLTLVLGKFVIAELRKLHAGQEIRKEGPSWHAGKAGTPTMGGIMFIVGSGVVAFLMGWGAMLQGQFAHLYVYLFALIFGLIGFVDDYRKVRQHQNEGLLTNALYVPFLNVTVEVNWIFYLVFAAFVIVGCVNAVNLTDGIDGQSSSVTFVVMVFFTAAAALWKQMPLALFPAALAGGLAAFFCYNRHPAKVFMGDTGSLFMGGAVAALAFAMDMPLILILVGIIYILETLSDIIQVFYFKATHGKRFFKMAPLHHHLELSGWSEAKLVTVFSGVTILFCILAWFGIQGRY